MYAPQLGQLGLELLGAADDGDGGVPRSEASTTTPAHNGFGSLLIGVGVGEDALFTAADPPLKTQSR